MVDAVGLGGSLRLAVERAVAGIDPAYFRSKRWFGSKSRTIEGVRLVDLVEGDAGRTRSLWLLIEVAYAGAEPQLFQVPVVLSRDDAIPPSLELDPNAVAFVLLAGDGELWAYDALAEDAYCEALYEQIHDERVTPTLHGEIAAVPIAGRMASRTPGPIRRITTEQSNSSIVYNHRLILKLFRQLAPGPNPDLEVPHFLTTRTDFDYIAKVAGYIECRPAAGEAISLAVLQDFVENQGDCYTNALGWVREYCAGVLELVEGHPRYSSTEADEAAARLASATGARAHRLGFITGLMHNALASSDEPEAFRPEPIARGDVERWERGMADEIREVVAAASEKAADVGHDEAEMLRAIVAGEERYLELIYGLSALMEEGCVKIRCHGDYHLGQLLQSGDDFVVLDFEGEPARSLAERRARHCPLRDVAGLLRSFDYAAYGGLFEVWDERGSDEAERALLEAWVQRWEERARDAVVAGYREASARNAGPRFAPEGPAVFARVVRIFEVEKAFYELAYEFNNRPTWIRIPAGGLLRTLSGG